MRVPRQFSLLFIFGLLGYLLLLLVQPAAATSAGNHPAGGSALNHKPAFIPSQTISFTTLFKTAESSPYNSIVLGDGASPSGTSDGWAVDGSNEPRFYFTPAQDYPFGGRISFHLYGHDDIGWCNATFRLYRVSDNATLYQPGSVNGIVAPGVWNFTVPLQGGVQYGLHFWQCSTSNSTVRQFQVSGLVSVAPDSNQDYLLRTSTDDPFYNVLWVGQSVAGVYQDNRWFVAYTGGDHLTFTFTYPVTREAEIEVKYDWAGNLNWCLADVELNGVRLQEGSIVGTGNWETFTRRLAVTLTPTNTLHFWICGGGGLSVRNVSVKLVPPPLTLEVFDLNGNPVNALTRNAEGWPVPNPLEVRMTVTNTTDLNLADPYLDFSIVNPDNVAERRFEVLDGAGAYAQLFPRYTETRHLGPLSPGQSVVTSTLVWVQPSVTSTLTFAAKFYTATGQITPLGEDGQDVAIPQARIHPLVVVPGFLGTWPPKHGGRLDPLTRIYDNLISATIRAGYQPGAAGSGGTLVSFGYNWRRSVSETGTITLKSDIQAITNTFDALRKPYVDYSRVDLVAHSMGGLVARAYIEEAGVNNEATVNRLITLATPHQGTPGAYRGWYGGDTNPLYLDEAMFQGLINGLAWCSLWGDWPPNNLNALWEDVDSFEYIRDNLPSVPQLLPPADVPAYLTRLEPPYDTWPFKDHQPPPNPFLDDLNNDLTGITGQLDYDVTKLRQVPRVISSFSPMDLETDSIYKVITPTSSPLWEYGEPVLSMTEKMPGDFLVPAYSGNLTNIITGSTIIPRDESNPSPGTQLNHVSIVYEPIMARRVISYITGIDVTGVNNFWNVPYKLPSEAEGTHEAIVSCAPNMILQIIDPSGRRAGIDPLTGEEINEIPGAVVPESDDGFQAILLPKLEGNYIVRGWGVASGDYAVAAIKSITTTQPGIVNSVSGPVTVGAVYTFALGIPPIYLPIILKNAGSIQTLLSQPAMVAPVSGDTRQGIQLPQFVSPVALPNTLQQEKQSR